MQRDQDLLTQLNIAKVNHLLHEQPTEKSGPKMGTKVGPASIHNFRSVHVPVGGGSR